MSFFSLTDSLDVFLDRHRLLPSGMVRRSYAYLVMSLLLGYVSYWRKYVIIQGKEYYIMIEVAFTFLGYQVALLRGLS